MFLYIIVIYNQVTFNDQRKKEDNNLKNTKPNCINLKYSSKEHINSST